MYSPLQILDRFTAWLSRLPDRIHNCQKCQDCQKSPKLSSLISSCFTKRPGVKVFNFHFLAVLAILAISLSLSLFMFRVLADHAHHALAVHDLALVTNLFD
jgi:hypothetical protein